MRKGWVAIDIDDVIAFIATPQRDAFHRQAGILGSGLHLGQRGAFSQPQAQPARACAAAQIALFQWFEQRQDRP